MSDLKKILILYVNKPILVGSTRTSSLMEDTMLREVKRTRHETCIPHHYQNEEP